MTLAPSKNGGGVVYTVKESLDPIYIGGGVGVWEDGEGLLSSLILCSPDGLYLRDASTGEARTVIVSLKKKDNDEGEENDERIGCFTNSPKRYGRIFVAKDSGMIESWMVPSEEDSKSPAVLDRSWRANPGSAAAMAKSPVLCISHHPVSPLLATGSADHSVRVWDSLQGFCTHNLKGAHGGVITALAWHPNQEQVELFSASEDGSIARWNLMSGSSTNLVGTFRGHTSSVRAIAVSPSGQFLVSGGRDKVINLWDLQARPRKKQQSINNQLLTLPVDESIEALGWIDGVTLWSAGEGGTVRVWQQQAASAATLKCIWTSPRLTNPGHTITHAVASHEGGLILATSDLNICRLPGMSGNVTAAFLVGHLGEVTDMALDAASDSAYPLLAVASNGPEIRLLSPTKTAYAYEPLQGHTEAVLSLAWDQDTLVSGSRDSTVRVWRRRGENGQFEPSRVLEGHADAVTAVALSPSNPLIASASSDGTVKVWKRDCSTSTTTSTTTNTAIWTVKAHEGDINAMTFTPKGGRFIVTVSQDRTGRIWRVEDGSRVAELTGHRRGVWCVACSPTEQLLATGSGDGSVRLWAMDGGCLRTLEAPNSTSVLRCAFTPDGQRLIAAMGDGTITVWSVRTGEALGTFDQHPDRIWSLAVHGDCFLSGDASGHIRLWRDVTVETEQARRQEQDKLLLRLQDLSNLLYRGETEPALLLALELDQPSRVYHLLHGLIQGRSGMEARDLLVRLIGSIRDPQMIGRLLGWMRDWNVSFKRALLTQTLLGALLLAWPVERLREARIEGAIESLNAILQHTERHYNRLDEIQIDGCLVGLMIANFK